MEDSHAAEAVACERLELARVRNALYKREVARARYMSDVNASEVSPSCMTAISVSRRVVSTPSSFLIVRRCQIYGVKLEPLIFDSP